MIHNPILRGFCPDPSIIRADADYYIAVSTFEWWPGIKLFHSRDLKNWEQLPSPLRRPGQLDLTGDPTSGGVWAPCLSYDGNRFYLLFTNVRTKKGRYYNTHNYMVYTDDICGDWSEPVYLNSIGFDPSLFHDMDGKKYLVNMVNGFKGILVQEIEPDTWRLVGERRKVYDGSGIGCTEGPHLYHIGDWYYLITAEGGTGYDHCVTLARSLSVWGPYETQPDNPVLTSDRNDPFALQKCGHADLTDTQNGEWYMVHLCSRPLAGQKWCTLGRETAIQKMRWTKDGWLTLEGGGRYARTLTSEPRGIVAHPFCREEQDTFPESCSDAVTACGREENGFLDHFESILLDVRYVSPRISYEEFADCRTRAGWLRLTGHESMNSLHHVSLIATRQQEAKALVETAMEFEPIYPEQAAGLAYVYDAMNFYLFVKTARADNMILTVIKSDSGIITDEIQPLIIPQGQEIKLRAITSKDGTFVRFFYNVTEKSVGAAEWLPAGEAFTTQILTDEHCRGFTGAHFGMYIHDLTGLSCHADFDYFTVRYE